MGAFAAVVALRAFANLLNEESSTESQLESNGWHLVLNGIQTETRYSPFGTNDPSGYLDWLLFQRSSLAGDTFSIRTEKYQAPVILQGVGVILPEPSTLYLVGFAAILLVATTARRRLIGLVGLDQTVISARSPSALRNWKRRSIL